MESNQDYPSPEGEWQNVKPPPYVNDTTEQRGGLLVHAPNLFTKPNNASLCTTDADKKRETNRYYIKGNDIPPSDPTHVLAFIPRKDGKVPKRRPQSNNILETVIKKHMEESGVNIKSAEFRDLILNDNLLTGVKYCVLWNGIKKTKFKENTDWSDKDLAVFDAGATAFDKEKVSHWLKTLIENMEDLNAYFGCEAVSNSNKRKKSDVADLNFSDLRVANDMTQVERVNDSLQADMQALDFDRRIRCRFRCRWQSERCRGRKEGRWRGSGSRRRGTHIGQEKLFIFSLFPFPALASKERANRQQGDS